MNPPLQRRSTVRWTDCRPDRLLSRFSYFRAGLMDAGNTMASRAFAAVAVRVLVPLLVGLLLWPTTARADTSRELTAVIKAVKPGIVAVGTYQATRRPPANFLGTGFAVADGRHILTSAHVLPKELDEERREQIAIFISRGEQSEYRPAEVVAMDDTFDLAVLKVSGPPLATLRLGDDRTVLEGQRIAFTGFPIGAVLGLYPVTHRGIVSAITPLSIPQLSARELDVRLIRQLQDRTTVFQLDATAYPGNSGSPLYEADTGRVIGIVNSVFIKESKERVLQDPSGISYAVPIRHARALLARLGLSK